MESFKVEHLANWRIDSGECDVKWFSTPPEQDSRVRILFHEPTMSMRVLSPELTLLGELPYKWKGAPAGIVQARVHKDLEKISVSYTGPQDFFAP